MTIATKEISRNVFKRAYDESTKEEKYFVFECLEYLTSKEAKSDWLLGIICDSHWSEKIGIEDAYAYCQLLKMRLSGNLFCKLGFIETTAYPDKENSKNKNNILSYKNYANQFNIKDVNISSGNYDHDGSLYANLEMLQLLPENKLSNALKQKTIQTKTLSDYLFGVEIGSYDLCRFVLTLRAEASGLVRIPYGKPIIDLIIKENNQYKAKGVIAFFYFDEPYKSPFTF